MNSLQLPSPIVQIKKREGSAFSEEVTWSQTNPNDLNQFPPYIIANRDLSTNFLLLLWENTQSACLIIDVLTGRIKHANSHFHSIMSKGALNHDIKSPSIAYSSPAAIQSNMLHNTSKVWKERVWSDLIRADHRETIIAEISIQTSWNGVFPLDLEEEAWVSVSMQVVEGLCLMTFAELMPRDPLQLGTALQEARESEKQKVFAPDFGH
jgi:hypothetical protein